MVSPPVCTPSEPSSGAFLLSGALRARGLDAPFLDLSPAFYSDCLGSIHDGVRRAAWSRAEDWIAGSTSGLDPSRHRTAAGIIHSALGACSLLPPGWKVTLMDLVPPFGQHRPHLVRELCETGSDPFGSFWERHLDPVLERVQPAEVLVSVAYLSQLAGAVSMACHLDGTGRRYSVGGSLPNSLRRTGSGCELLERVFPRVVYGDGSELVGGREGAMLERVVFPDVAGDHRWLSPRMIVPFTLSTGCCWNRCLFCPDRDSPWSAAPAGALDAYLESIPAGPPGAGRPVLHLLDSTLPPGLLARAMPSIGRSGLGYFGFARPARDLLDACPPSDLAGSGCLMLQLGIESGSEGLLSRYGKGFHPREAESVLSELAGAGIRTYAYMLFGLPGENADDRRATVDLLERAGGAVDFLNLSIFNLPRHCELADRAAEFDISIRSSPRDRADRIALYHEFTCLGETPRVSARRFIGSVGGSSTAIREAMRRTPRWFRAAHLALMSLPGRNPP